MRFVLRTFALAVAFAVCGHSAEANGQAPPGPTGPRFDVAEVRGLAEVPARADMGFLEGLPGPSFPGATKAVVAKFQSASLPSGSTGLSIAWLRLGGRTPLVVSSESVTANELSSGAYALLSQDSLALQAGRYQVSVVDSSGRIFRAVEFVIAGATAARPGPAVASTAKPDSTPPGSEASVESHVAYTLGEFALAYPGSYSVQPLSLGSGQGLLLVRPNPVSAILLAFRAKGRIDLDSGARAFVEGFSRATRYQSLGGVLESRSLPKGDLAGRPAIGKLFVYSALGGKMIATMYAFDVDGTSFLTGYVTVSSTASSGTTLSGKTTAEQSAEDFFQIVRSLRHGPAAVPPTADEPPATPAKRPKRSKPSDIARLPPADDPALLLVSY